MRRIHAFEQFSATRGGLFQQHQFHGWNEGPQFRELQGGYFLERRQVAGESWLRKLEIGGVKERFGDGRDTGKR